MLVQVLKGHRLSVLSISFDAADETLVSGAARANLMLFDLAKGKILVCSCMDPSHLS